MERGPKSRRRFFKAARPIPYQPDSAKMTIASSSMAINTMIPVMIMMVFAIAFDLRFSSENRMIKDITKLASNAMDIMADTAGETVVNATLTNKFSAMEPANK